MPRAAHRTAISLAAFGALLLAASGNAAEPATPQAEPKPDRIRIEYVPPPNPAHREIYDLMRQRHVLEKFRDFLKPIRLAEPLMLKFDGCEGIANAWYEPDAHAVTVCYEYIDEVLQNAPKETTAAGVTRDDAIVGPGIEVFLHEIAHALFHMLQIPILGREEDAADQVAAYTLLQLGREESRRTVLGVAYMYGHEAQGQTPELKHFAGAHGLPAQRFYNLLCMAYGADPELFADLVEKKHLPEFRADYCVDEYKQVAFAVRVLINPHMDPDLAREMRERQWIERK
jgi:hypothetical protein